MVHKRSCARRAGAMGCSAPSIIGWSAYVALISLLRTAAMRWCSSCAPSWSPRRPVRWQWCSPGGSRRSPVHPRRRRRGWRRRRWGAHLLEEEEDASDRLAAARSATATRRGIEPDPSRLHVRRRRRLRCHELKEEGVTSLQQLIQLDADGSLLSSLPSASASA